MLRPHRQHPAWWAFALHRISGVGLALFLPLHFFVLGLALEQEAQLDGLLRWTDNVLFKLVEMGLVFLLAIHLTGGLRLLALELLPWRDWQKSLIALASGVSLLAALGFLLNAV